MDALRVVVGVTDTEAMASLRREVADLRTRLGVLRRHYEAFVREHWVPIHPAWVAHAGDPCAAPCCVCGTPRESPSSSLLVLVPDEYAPGGAKRPCAAPGPKPLHCVCRYCASYWVGAGTLLCNLIDGDAFVVDHVLETPA